MSWPTLAVIIPTYNRLEILHQCLNMLIANLNYSGHIDYWIGNDGDTPIDIPVLNKTLNVIEGPSGSLGANLNRLINAADADVMLQLDDDHILLEPLDLDPHVKHLSDNKSAGWIRLMEIAEHKLHAYLIGSYWYVVWDSDELYITSNRPHLKHKRFHDQYGPYFEGFKLGATEDTFCHKCIDRGRKNDKLSRVLVPLNVHTESMWDHIGHSWQLEGK